jgi:hypothetical protein
LLALEVLHRFDRGVLGNGQHPARRLAGGFAEKELANLVHLGGVFLDPIVPGDAAVEVAEFDVARDFLGANEADL